MKEYIIPDSLKTLIMTAKSQDNDTDFAAVSHLPYYQ